ncbi:NitT/TauT family transport system permease protein [Pseudoclavibacter sp. JAI123]|uniref:ABC transporter permease n=1 Tax=Pseudoclavibacter sp. JAI123 TaxID=2723065 RepID=UPI0015C9C32C|nr:ABC transporter permease [Pseudoclavibacter sp. JAI123]NYF13893.1 NitT/TauT family transport system permease protein [Pseudoclavibacter sp. JAI123]
MRRAPWLAPTVTLVAIVAIWEIGVRLSEVPAFLLPAPSAVGASLVDNWALLMGHAGVTIVETLIGFALSAVVGIALAVVIVMWPLVGAAIFPIVVASQVIPKVAIAPLMVVWIGTGMTTSALIAFVMAFFPVVVNATLGMKSVQDSSVDLMRSMGSSQWQVFRYLRFPSALPHIMTGLQLAIAFAIVGAIVGEFVGSDSGLGYLLIVTQGNLRTDLLFADLVVLTAMGLLLYYAVELIGKFMLRNRS